MPVSYLALDEFAQYNVAAAATFAIGNLVGGEIGTDEGGFSHNEGVRGIDDLVWDMHQPKARLETIYKGETLISAALRSAWNALPSRIALSGGVVHASVTLAASISTGYVDAMEISCGGIGEPVKVNYDIIALKASPLIMTAAGVTAITGTAPFAWHSGSVTISGAGYGCEDFSVKIENGLTHCSSLDAKAANSQRLPEGIDLGSEKISASFTVKAPMYVDFTRDAPTLPVTATIVIGNGYTSKTIVATGLYVKPFGTPIEAGEGKVSWKMEGETKNNPLSSVGAAGLTIT